MNLPIAQLPQIIAISPRLPQPGQSHVTPTAGGGSPASPLHTLLQPGATFSGHITSASAQPGGTFMLNLTTADGQQLHIQASRPLPVGTQVQVHIQPNGQPVLSGITLPAGAQRAAAAQSLGQNWQTLQTALTTLSTTLSTTSPHFTHLLAAIPQQGVLLPMLVQLLRATQTQDVGDWVGDDLAALLKSAGVDFAQDLQNLQLLQSRPETPESWRALLFPFIEHVGDNPQQGGFFWRQQAGDANQPPQTRFVLQVQLSALGPIQLDGLYQAGHVHLKLRLHQALEPGFATGLQHTTQQVLLDYGLTGGIQVEITPEFPVDPLHDLQHAAGHMNITT